MKINWHISLIVLGMLFPATMVTAQETSTSGKKLAHQVLTLDNTSSNLTDIDSKLFTIPEDLDPGWIAEKPIKTDIQESQSSNYRTISSDKKNTETQSNSTDKPTAINSCEQPFEVGETEKPAQLSETIIAEKTQPVAAPTRFTHPAKQPTPPQPETQVSQTVAQKPQKPQKSESPEEITRYYTLAKADHWYRCGDTAMAEKLYREVKKPFTTETQINRETIGQPVYEPTELAPGGGVYWKLYQESLQENAVYKSKKLTALKLLTEQYPEFIPGHLQYAEVLKADKQPKESLTVLDKAFGLYPNEVPLVEAKIKADQDSQNWLTASLTARQFALFNPDHFRAAEFKKIADDDLARYQSDLQNQMAWSTVGNVVLGGVGAALTGNVLAPLSSLQTAFFLVQGESVMGNNVSNELKEKLTLVDDPEVVAYVNEIGKKLASVAGRNEFKYEFFIVKDENLNAFALPGGKIFVNAGAIAKTNSEAELAGLLAHELSHTVLSHGFQQMTQGGLTKGITEYIPYVGGVAGNLLTLNYSREMEEQADLFGTRLLVASGYAADGMRNLMVTMEKENKDKPPVWLSTHPDTSDRVKYLEEIIVKNNLNRYSYEGVERHQEIREKVAEMLEAYKAEKEGKNPESKTDKKNPTSPQTEVKPANN